LEASLVYRVSSRTAWATQRNPVSKIEKKEKEKEKKRNGNEPCVCVGGGGQGSRSQNAFANFFKMWALNILLRSSPELGKFSFPSLKLKSDPDGRF
jgi:hypothetical protein